MKKDILLTRHTGTPEISIRLPLEHHYRQFMESVTVQGTSTEERFLGGVQCIIWGFLYIEATTNKMVARLFKDPVNPAAPIKHFWKLAEYAKLTEKVEALANAFEPDETEASRRLKQVNKLNLVRNKLVHYK